MKKQNYCPPQVALIEVKYEGIICSSGEGRDPWEN